MDKYNIITPTNNLNDLEIDMSNWYNLPFNIRMRSNDDCQRIYGCNVVDLYHAIKEKINNQKDIMSMDRNNLVVESAEFEDIENLGYNIGLSKQLQESPYIVIIDPDIDTQEELDIRFNSFNCLNAKNKRLSNDYSWQLYGYNVYDMYNKMMSIINHTEVDSSNLVVSTENSKVEALAEDKLNVINRGFINNDPVIIGNAMNEYKDVSESVYTRSLLYSYNTEYKNFVKESFDTSIFPSVVPNMTDKDVINSNIILNIPKDNTYYESISKTIKEFNDNKCDETEKALLELGWNPYIPFDSLNIKEAKINQLLELRKFVDVSKICTEDYVPYESQYTPVYFILGYPSNFEQFANRVNYNKAAISFKPGLDIAYIMNGIESDFKGFLKVSKDVMNVDPAFNCCDVIAVLVDSATYTALYNNCEGLCNHDEIIPGFQSIYAILTKCKNPYAPEAVKLLYSQFVDMILRIASVDLTNYQIKLGDFMLNTPNDNGDIYKIYNGPMKDYNRERILSIMRTICDQSTRLVFAESVGINDDAKKYIANAIEPKIVIQTTKR